MRCGGSSKLSALLESEPTCETASAKDRATVEEHEGMTIHHVRYFIYLQKKSNKARIGTDRTHRLNRVGNHSTEKEKY